MAPKHRRIPKLKESQKMVIDAAFNLFTIIVDRKSRKRKRVTQAKSARDENIKVWLRLAISTVKSGDLLATQLVR